LLIIDLYEKENKFATDTWFSQGFSRNHIFIAQVILPEIVNWNAKVIFSPQESYSS